MPAQPVVYIYDGIRRWWRIRRFQMIGALLLCIGIIIGMIIGHLTERCRTAGEKTRIQRQMPQFSPVSLPQNAQS